MHVRLRKNVVHTLGSKCIPQDRALDRSSSMPVAALLKTFSARRPLRPMGVLNTPPQGHPGGARVSGNHLGTPREGNLSEVLGHVGQVPEFQVQVETNLTMTDT